jgi:hypothetical protein
MLHYRPPAWPMSTSVNRKFGQMGGNGEEPWRVGKRLLELFILDFSMNNSLHCAECFLRK